MSVSEKARPVVTFCKNKTSATTIRRCKNLSSVLTLPLKNEFDQRSNTSSSSRLTYDSLHRYQPTRHFFGFFGATNPFLEALQVSSSDDGATDTTTTSNTGGDVKRPKYIKYTKMRPDNITKAASELQAKYLNDLKKLEESLGEDTSTCISYEDLVPKLERITRPLNILQNHVALFSMVRKEPEFETALHQANGIIQMNYGTLSSRLRNALVRMEHELQTMPTKGSSKEEKRTVRYLLRQRRFHGCSHGDDNDPETMKQITSTQERLRAVQTKFLSKSLWTVEEHGKAATPQELIPIMYEISALQQHQSRLLGYHSYLDYSLDYHDAMAKNLQEIEAVHGVFEKLGAVQTFASDDYQSFYLDLLSTASKISTSEYFEFNRVLNGLFELFQEMFDISIREQERDVNGWHRDVRLFHVYSASTDDGKGDEIPLASFYVDPYRRPYKDSGCFMTPLQYKNGDSIPIAAVSFDIRPPVWDDAPIQLELQQVLNVFHEFGHLLQHILADVKLGAFTGAQNIEEDASETISQFMEYWLFDGEVMSKILQSSSSSGEVISKDSLDILFQHQKATKSNQLLHRLFLGQLELELSSSFDPHGGESMISLQRKCAERFIPCHIPPKGNIDPLVEIFQNNAYGKCSMQYRYIWSEIMSADAFSAFLENDVGKLKEGEEFKRVCKQLRKEWIGKGSSVNTSQAYECFRGRSASMDSLIARYGLS
jgi:Zn-dependent oligopeptidase